MENEKKCDDDEDDDDGDEVTRIIEALAES